LHNYLGKLAMAILLTPLIYAGHALSTVTSTAERDSPAV